MNFLTPLGPLGVRPYIFGKKWCLIQLCADLIWRIYAKRRNSHGHLKCIKKQKITTRRLRNKQSFLLLSEMPICLSVWAVGFLNSKIISLWMLYTNTWMIFWQLFCRFFDDVFFWKWFIDNFFRRFDWLFFGLLSAVLSQQILGLTYLRSCFSKILTNFVTRGWKNYNAGGTNLGIGSPT